MIYFVGAGAGAADLITLRGARLLERADVVVWAGSLVNPELLELCNKNCQIFDSARMTLEETTQVLATAEWAGKLAVRLHTGDPSIYGAIREQMEALKVLGLDYTVVPGVSSFCGAAAALRCEYTVPEISQTVIISRMEGRTPVPDKEKIRSLAVHGASMVLFLSSGMIPALVEELKAGGAYSDETPCAVVYKATWSDEKIVRGTLANIAQKAAEAGINKTALVLVGDFLGSEYNKSKLYDATFSTEFRAAAESACESREKAEPSLAVEKNTLLGFSRIFIASFTERGKKLSETLAEFLPEKCEKTPVCESLCKKDGEGLPLQDFVKSAFSGSDSQKTLLVFVGASGIAVRSIAPFVGSKLTDPAVVCVDEGGQFAIPLLSGHIGEANLAGEIIARKTGACACITTATDVNGLLAVDVFAGQKGWKILNPEKIKLVSGKMLGGEKIKIYVDQPLSPLHCFNGSSFDKKFLSQAEIVQNCEEADVLITVKNLSDSELGEKSNLVLVPPLLSLGVGCKKDCDGEKLYSFLTKTLDLNSLCPCAVGAIASIDIKKDERAIQDASKRFGVPFKTFDADSLNKVKGNFSSSDFVLNTVGVDCVCERSALAVGGGRLLVRKTACDGMTCAVALLGGE